MDAVDTSEIECDKLVDDGAAKDKHNALYVALRPLASGFEKVSMLSLSNFFVPRSASVISTGSLKLDLALGIGGLPKVLSYMAVSLFDKSSSLDI